MWRKRGKDKAGNQEDAASTAATTAPKWKQDMLKAREAKVSILVKANSAHAIVRGIRGGGGAEAAGIGARYQYLRPTTLTFACVAWFVLQQQQAQAAVEEDPMQLYGHLPVWKRDMKVRKWREEKAKKDAALERDRQAAEKKKAAIFSDPQVLITCLASGVQFPHVPCAPWVRSACLRPWCKPETMRAHVLCAPLHRGGAVLPCARATEACRF